MISRRALAFASIVPVVAACTGTVAEPSRVASRLPPAALATAENPFEPIPNELGLDPHRVELGRRLFREARMSADGRHTCIDCHELSQGGVVPGEARSNHPRNATGPYNVPTVFNVGFNFRFNWQGRFETLEEHLGGLMMKPDVMNGGSWPDIVARLAPHYTASFVEAGYPEGVSEQSVKDVFSAYQRSLVTPDSRFDRHLRDEIELAEDEAAGYALFKDVGCVTCHQGTNVGGNLFQRFGVMEDAFGGRDLVERDLGRMLVTHREEDAHVFRVPSLRNVEVTGPYFHDGSAETLDAAVRHMGRVQLGYVLTDREVLLIAAFLRSLTGEYQGELLSRPEGA